MLRYIVRRLLQALLIIILVSMAVFMLIRLLPGDPIQLIVSQNIMTQAQADPEMYDRLLKENGLDKPVPIQYINWLSQVLRGNFGRSILKNYVIMDDIRTRLVVTITLGITAFLVSVVLGALLGVISAIRRGKFIDTLVTLIANVGITSPTFLTAIVLIFFVGFKLELLPLYGYTLPWNGFWESFRRSVMPVFVMALGPMASTCRQTRSSILEVLNQDHVRTAWSKGLMERRIIFKHVLKNSLMPIITLQGSMLQMILGGSAIVETIFVIPGMGKLMVDAMLSNDYPVVQAVALVMTFVVVLSNLVVDLLYGWVDPRIQYE